MHDPGECLWMIEIEENCLKIFSIFLNQREKMDKRAINKNLNRRWVRSSLKALYLN